MTSLLCAIAPSIAPLIAFRALQGGAGALLTPSSLAVIIATFPAKERGPAIGAWTAWGTIAGALGPLTAEILPGILLFSLGLSITVAPLTAAVLAGVDQDEAGIGSAINNAVARVAGLIATVAIGALVAAQFSSSLDRRLSGRPLGPRGHAAVEQAKQLTLGRPSVAHVPSAQAQAIVAASDRASVDAFRWGIGIASLLVIGGGLIGAVGIRDPRRPVAARHCAGGQLAGAPLDAAGVHAAAAA